MGRPSTLTKIQTHNVDAAFEALQTAYTDAMRPKPGLHLSARMCAGIEALIGIGATQSEAALLSAIKRWAALEIGSVRLDLTPAQLEEIQYRAEKNGRSPEMEFAAAVALIQDLVFGAGYVAPR